MKTIYEKFGNNEVEQGVIAEILGHKSPKSGTFLTKIASMRDYGLIDGRGKVHVTEIGARIAFREDENRYNDALLKAVTSIPLWRTIYEKYTKKGIDIPSEDFWLDLKNICELTIEQAKNQAPDVLNAFKEDIKLIKIGQSASTTTPTMSQEALQTQQATSTLKTPPADMIDIGYGNVKAYLPKDNTAEAWNKLKAIVEAYVNV